jgi:hypothetical protein
MRNLDSCRRWRCTLCPCKVRNKFLVNFWNRTILLCIPYIMRRFVNGRKELHVANVHEIRPKPLRLVIRRDQWPVGWSNATEDSRTPLIKTGALRVDGVIKINYASRLLGRQTLLTFNRSVHSRPFPAQSTCLCLCVHESRFWIFDELLSGHDAWVLWKYFIIKYNFCLIHWKFSGRSEWHKMTGTK